MKSLPKFNNQKLFDQAFTHRSFLNEAGTIKSKKNQNKERILSNERLEFLGDSILSYIVSTYLYKRYDNFDEGTLTNIRSLLVNSKTLSRISNELNFGKYLKLSKGEEESKGRSNPTLLANCFEAYIGALYLDQGINSVSEFLNEVLLTKIENLVQKGSFKDPKSMLQEKVQSKKQNSPIYKVIEESGPPHEKTFTVGVYVENNMLGKGTGRSKRIAEEKAAKEALSKLETQTNT